MRHFTEEEVLAAILDVHRQTAQAPVQLRGENQGVEARLVDEDDASFLT